MTQPDDIEGIEAVEDPFGHEPAPLGFKIVLWAATAYLVVRVIQMIGWMF